MSSRGEMWLDEVAARLQDEVDAGAAQRSEELTARELLAHFAYERRGSWINGVIRAALEARRLTISPAFEHVWVDEVVSIKLGVDAEASRERALTDPTIRVGALPAAHHAPVTVRPDDQLERATTLMGLWDYSQLPVWSSSREVKGVVSWKSIGGRMLAHGTPPSIVGECLERARIVEIDSPLVEAVAAVYEYDHILVRGRDKSITGILTAADLALQYKDLALPYLLIGEIEHHLRNLVRGRFTVEEFREAADSEEEILGPENLTWGGFGRLLEQTDSWEKLGLRLDRRAFIKRLDAMRRIRNDVMHFSLDALPSSALEQLEATVRFFRTLGGGVPP